MNKYRIWLSPPHMEGAEIRYIQDAFLTNWIAPVGPHITAFEKGLSDYLGGVHCVALNSGTSAIHLALLLCGVKNGDEVICSSLTFAGTCYPIAYLGAQPVFVDSEKDTWNMCPELLKRAIEDRLRLRGKKPAAIIVVHLYGMPARLNEVLKIAREYEIPVIEDAAESLGSRYFGKLTGTCGDLGIFSFNGNKIITTSGGGALVSFNPEFVRTARFLATQARDPAPHYEHSQIGFNYRLSNICAAVGVGQLEVLDNRISRRRAIFEFYKQHLNPEVKFQEEPEGFFSNRWLSVIYTRSRDKIINGLASFGIEARPVWKPMHLQPVFRQCFAYLSGVAEDLFQNGVCLPSGSSLTETEQAEIVEIVNKLVC